MDILLRGAAVKFLSRKNSLKFDDVLAAKKTFFFLISLVHFSHASCATVSSIICHHHHNSSSVFSWEERIALQYSIGKKEDLVCPRR